MTIEQFLQDLLESQNLSDSQENDLQKHKEEITNFLRAEFGNDPVIKYAGSREKGTMVCDKYDLDIVCYFPSSDTRSLKEIRTDMAEHLAKKYLITQKASAERILDLKGSTAPIDFHIDVVPGRFIENTKDVFLHIANGDKERMQTNLKTHINHIVNSGCVPVIRLVKLWAIRNNVKIKTFVLELFVVQALSGSQSKTNLKVSFLKVIEAFKDEFSTTQLVDPANSNNVVSRLVDDSEKSLVEASASSTFNKIGASDELVKWQKVFEEISILNNGQELAISKEEETDIVLGDYSHRKSPHWPKSIQGTVEIKKCVVNGTTTLSSNGWPIPDGCGLNYIAEVSGIFEPYEVWWQVVNTGEHASSFEGGLRGNFEKPKNINRPLQQVESSQYTGKHWIQCYIVKDDYLVAESKPFFLNVVNKTRKKFRKR